MQNSNCAQPPQTVLVDSWGDRWVSISTAAKALGVSEDAIRDLAAEGSLQARLLAPGAVCVCLDGVACLLRASQQKGGGS